MRQHRRQGRGWGGRLAVLAGMLLAAQAAQAQAISPISFREDAQNGKTHLLASYYQSGVARLGAGDPAGARTVFETVGAAAAIPQVQFSLAAAIVLGNFTARERALPPIRAALAAEPAQPLYRVLATLADPDLSVLRRDGALYFTAAGARIIDEAAVNLDGERDADHAKSLAVLLGTRTPTGDRGLPERVAGFAAMLGAGRGGRLGQSLALAVPDAAFRPYEAAFVERVLARRVTGAGRVADASQR